jgi:hypothetical protein
MKFFPRRGCCYPLLACPPSIGGSWTLRSTTKTVRGTGRKEHCLCACQCALLLGAGDARGRLRPHLTPPLALTVLAGSSLGNSLQKLTQVTQLAPYPASVWAPSPPELSDLLQALELGANGTLAVHLDVDVVRAGGGGGGGSWEARCPLFGTLAHTLGVMIVVRHPLVLFLCCASSQRIPAVSAIPPPSPRVRRRFPDQALLG